MKFTKRQEAIIKIVKNEQPITSEAIAEKLGVTRAALRADLAILTMTGTLDARPKVGYVYLGKKIDGEILENLSKIKVGDIMSKPVTVNGDTTVYDAIVHLFLHNSTCDFLLYLLNFPLHLKLVYMVFLVYLINI